MLCLPRSVIVSSILSIKNFDFYAFLKSKKIEKIVLQCDYTILDYSKLSKCVYHIECDKGCWSIDPGILPISITHLSVSNPIVCKKFNITKLPSHLTYLEIGFETYNNFWSAIDNLPPNLEELHVKGKFNLSCDNLPYGLKKLVIKSIMFNKSLDNLPTSLEYLEIQSESSFSNISFNSLPEYLTTLIINLKCSSANKLVLSKLPNSLKNLTLNNRNTDFEIKFPESLEILDITTNLHNLAFDILPNLPSALKAIKLGRGKTENLNYIKQKYPDVIIL